MKKFVMRMFIKKITGKIDVRDWPAMYEASSFNLVNC